MAPLEPLEEVYYALAELRDQVDGEQALPAADHHRLRLEQRAAHGRAARQRRSRTLLDEPPDAGLLLRTAMPAPISPRMTAGTVVWYLNGEAALERIRMAALFGVDQICLSDLTSVADYENYRLLEGGAAADAAA